MTPLSIQSKQKAYSDINETHSIAKLFQTYYRRDYTTLSSVGCSRIKHAFTAYTNPLHHAEHACCLRNHVCSTHTKKTAHKSGFSSNICAQTRKPMTLVLCPYAIELFGTNAKLDTGPQRASLESSSMLPPISTYLIQKKNT